MCQARTDLSRVQMASISSGASCRRLFSWKMLPRTALFRDPDQEDIENNTFKVEASAQKALQDPFFGMWHQQQLPMAYQRTLEHFKSAKTSSKKVSSQEKKRPNRAVQDRIFSSKGSPESDLEHPVRTNNFPWAPGRIWFTLCQNGTSLPFH
ncbi:uncharacterized protein BKA78DRAFT_328049 [Phyllosticta capitalensis]|uniref:uncharacterized protein n=1 Tax=Phyllosticta capitalensis TaxID=121624 RepID=UPI00312FB85C